MLSVFFAVCCLLALPFLQVSETRLGIPPGGSVYWQTPEEKRLLEAYVCERLRFCVKGRVVCRVQGRGDEGSIPAGLDQLWPWALPSSERGPAVGQILCWVSPLK